MSENPRARRLAEQIKVIVAQMLERRIKDPRLGFVTITDVRVTGDLQNASIFYTVLGSDEDRTKTAAALESAKGLIRSEVGKQTGIRLTPTIEFHLDSVPETAAHINDALAEARKRDDEVAALRAGKVFAGDSDPYRKPIEPDDLDDATVNPHEVDEYAPGAHTSLADDLERVENVREVTADRVVYPDNDDRPVEPDDFDE